MSDMGAVAIFAKAPIAGFAKTRLIARLGAEGAADLARRMTMQTVATALAADIGPVSLWCTPSRDHALFSLLATVHSIDLHCQCGADLGARMLQAFELLTVGGPTIVLGADCPPLKASHLIDCAKRLRKPRDVVFLPTEDGGYALVGAAKPWAELFRDMPWGTGRVMQETRMRARCIGLRLFEPALLWDLDTPADYERAAALGLV